METLRDRVSILSAARQSLPFGEVELIETERVAFPVPFEFWGYGALFEFSVSRWLPLNRALAVGKNMNIRESIISDLGAIHASHKNAFGEPEGPIVAQLACDILKDESAQPLLSLVVEQQDEIVGHVIFSSLKIEGVEHLSVYILAPLAVSKNFQRQGLGTQLITHGLNILKSQGVDAVFVYGSPSYYGRIGFKLGHSIAAPYELEYPEAWMALELKQGCLLKVQGLAKCCDSLMSPEYW